MKDWALWTFGILVIQIVIDIAVLGLGLAPIMKKRGDFAWSVFANGAFVVWGAIVIFR